MKLSITLAARYLRGRLLRSLLTGIAVLFGVMIIFGMNGIVPAVRASFNQNLRDAAHEVDLVVLPTTDRAFDAALAGEVLAVPGVTRVTAVLERPVLLPAAFQLAPTGGQPIDALVVSGWDPSSSQALVPISPVAGRWLAAGERDTMMVRASLLDRTGLGLGDSVRLPSAHGSAAFTIVGVLPERPLSGDEEVYIPLVAAQQLFNLPGRINAISGDIAGDQDAEAVRQAVAARLGPGYTLGSVAAGGQEWEGVLQIAEAVFTLFGTLALIMGGFILFNTFRTNLAERRHDIGMLRAIGASRRSVLALVLAEALLLGIAGTAIGMLVGFLAVRTLLPLLNGPWERFFGASLGTPEFGLPVYALSVTLGLGIPLISALVPALAASRVTPLEALRPLAEEQSGGMAARRVITGAALVGLALATLLTRQVTLVALGALLFLVGLVLLNRALVSPLGAALGKALAALAPREGYVVRHNLARQPGRSAVTVSTTMISLAILVALGGLADTFTSGLMGQLERSMRADYLLLPEALVLGQANVTAGPELAERLRATAGIANITTIRRSETQIGGVTTQVIGIDPLTYPQLGGLVFSDGDPAAAYREVAQGRALIVNGLLAAQQGLAIGQELTLETAEGPRSYRVAGVGVDYLNSRVATAYLSHANLAADFHETGDVLLMANRSAEAQPAVVEQELRVLVREFPAFSLLSYDKWHASQLEANQTRSNILYVLMAFLAVPALLGLANTLGINVLERRREIGMLRAIGTSRRQVQRMVVVESMLLSGVGVILGVAGGLWLGYALVGVLSIRGFSFDYVFPWLGITVAVVAGLVFGLLAALLPARHAARVNVVTALQYE